ncbi:MAG: SUMF1/EgtB/PvdO family nonheme iron enzyme [Verrucomicrobiota bacterium]
MIPGLNQFSPGQKVGAGRYSLIELLGQGGMGVVWLAQDERLQEQVALKFLLPFVQNDPEALDSLRRETARSHKLAHPNIIRTHDFHEFPGETPFISMEYVSGKTLDALRWDKPDGFFTWEELKPLVRQLCDALDYAHTEGVVHRDLKPANMMLDGKGRLKLSDFGIAAVLSESAGRITSRAAKGGTEMYMSPQQVNGDAPAITDDIYALGASLYQLLTSQPPFYTGVIPYQVIHVEADSLHQRLDELGLRNDIPPTVSTVIMSCLAKQPGQRPRSAREVLVQLNFGRKTADPAHLMLKVEPVNATVMLNGRLLGSPVPECISLESGQHCLVEVSAPGHAKRSERFYVTPGLEKQLSIALVQESSLSAPAPVQPRREPAALPAPSRQPPPSRSPTTGHKSPGSSEGAGAAVSPPAPGVRPGFQSRVPVVPKAERRSSGRRGLLVVVLLALVLAAGYFGWQQFNTEPGPVTNAAIVTGSIKVSAEPANTVAVLVSDKASVTNSSLAPFTSLAPGTYTLTLTHPTCLTTQLVVSLKSNETVDLGVIRLTEGRGNLLLDVAVEGVRYEITHQLRKELFYQDTTDNPMVFTNLLAGPYQVVLKRKGWANITSNVTVVPAQVAVFKPTYKAGSLRISSGPQGVEYELWSNDARVSQPDLDNVPPGQYQVRFKWPVYELSHEVPVVLAENEAREVAYQFPHGTVELSADVPKVTFYLDEQAENAKNHLGEGSVTAVVPAGPHKFIAKAAQRPQVIEKTVEIQPGATATQRFEFNPIKPTQPDPGGSKIEVDPQKAALILSQFAKTQTISGEINRVDLGNGVELPVCHIAAGQFLMGSTKLEREWAAQVTGNVAFEGTGEPQVTRIAEKFWMGQTEVTVGQWRRFAQVAGFKTDAEGKDTSRWFDLKEQKWLWLKGSWKTPLFGSGFTLQESHPATCIKWGEAVRYCDWLTEMLRKTGQLPPKLVCRLPTEAEWEYACRGNKPRADFWWREGEVAEMNVAGRESVWKYEDWNDRYPWLATADAGDRRRQNGFLLVDMLGNVREWCLDSFDKKGAHPTLYTSNGSERVVRGGSFADPRADARCASRFGEGTDIADSRIGFRVCIGLPAQ